MSTPDTQPTPQPPKGFRHPTESERTSENVPKGALVWSDLNSEWHSVRNIGSPFNEVCHYAVPATPQPESETPELKPCPRPCPFCNGTSVTVSQMIGGYRPFYVSCAVLNGGCGADGPSGNDVNAAIESWNNRALETRLRAAESALATETHRREEAEEQVKCTVANCTKWREERDTLRAQLTAAEARNAELVESVEGMKSLMEECRDAGYGKREDRDQFLARLQCMDATIRGADTLLAGQPAKPDAYKAAIEQIADWLTRGATIKATGSDGPLFELMADGTIFSRITVDFSGQPAPSPWRPMSEAPTGVRVIHHNGKDVEIGRLLKDPRGPWSNVLGCHPKGWMPLPPVVEPA